MNVSRAETRTLQGLAVLLMIVHHAFGLPGLIDLPATYIGLIPGVPFEEYLGRYAKVCVALFLMISGYGLTRQNGPWWPKTRRRVWAFFRVYWVWFVVLVGIGALFFADVQGHDGPRFSTDPTRLVTNAFALRHDYAYEWWFAEVYLVLLVLAPAICRLGRWPWLLLAGAVAAFCLGAALDVLRFKTPVFSLSNLLIWQLPFVCGVLLAQGTGPARRLPPAWLSGFVVGLGFLAVELLAPRAQTPWLIVSSPLSFVALTAVLRLLPRAGARCLDILADRALSLWLVHPFLVYYFAQPLIYAPLWAPIVLAWLVFLTLGIVMLAERLFPFLRPSWTL